MPTLGFVLWAVAGLALAYLIFKVGLGVLRSASRPVPAPPPPGELRRVSVRYRCSICGLELRLTLSPDDDPEPPRHCQEEMLLVAPVE